MIFHSKAENITSLIESGFWIEKIFISKFHFVLTR